MTFRVRMQLAEALGQVNRWYCSQFYRREIKDPELLIRYFVDSGGADDFARRYNEAMSMANRWYCSEFHRRDVREPEVLWAYYMKARAREAAPRGIAC
jgi:hypothetical protein